MKTKIIHIFILIGAMGMAACNRENTPVTNKSVTENIGITARYAAPYEGMTKTSFTPAGKDLATAWAKNDMICLMQSNDGSYQTSELLLTEGEGKTTGTFTGRGFSVIEESSSVTYHAFYPASKGGASPEEWKQNATYEGQVQRGYNDASHLGRYDYLIAPAVSTLSEDIPFSHVGVIFCFNITLPKQTEAIPLSLTLSTLDENLMPTTEGGLYKDCGETKTSSVTLNFADCTTPTSQFNAYLICHCNIPSGQPIRLTLALEDGTSYHSDLTTSQAIPGTDTEDSNFGILYETPVTEWTANESSTFTDGITGSQYEGSGTIDDPFIIANAKNLKYLVDHASGTSGQYFLLTTDITIREDVIWEPIGESLKEFAGHFNGNGHVISGKLNPPTTSSSNSSYFGFFGYAKNATVSNLTVKADITATAFSTGGVIGSANNTTISNCHYIGEMTYTKNLNNGNLHYGGVVGYANNNSKVIGCTTQGRIASNGTAATTASFLGGIVGNTSKSSIEMCANYAEIEGGNLTSNASFYTGGIVGGVLNISSSAPNSIKECYNYGKITGGNLALTNSSNYIGGIIGQAYYCEIADVYNEAEVSISESKGRCAAGGIVGYFGQESTLLRGMNKGNIIGYSANTQSASYTGGLTGNVNSETCTIHQSRNEGNVSVTTNGKANDMTFTGSYTGYALSPSLVFSCCSSADVEIKDAAGQSVPSNTPAYYIGNAETTTNERCPEGHQPLR